MKGMKIDTKIEYKLRTLYLDTCQDSIGHSFSQDFSNIASLMKAISHCKMKQLGTIKLMKWGIDEPILKIIVKDLDLNGIDMVGFDERGRRFEFKI